MYENPTPYVTNSFSIIAIFVFLQMLKKKYSCQRRGGFLYVIYSITFFSHKQASLWRWSWGQKWSFLRPEDVKSHAEETLYGDWGGKKGIVFDEPCLSVEQDKLVRCMSGNVLLPIACSGTRNSPRDGMESPHAPCRPLTQTKGSSSISCRTCAPPTPSLTTILITFLL